MYIYINRGVCVCVDSNIKTIARRVREDEADIKRDSKIERERFLDERASF